MKDIFDLLGRIMLSVIFFFEASDSLRFFEGTKATMSEYGILWRQDLLLTLAIGGLFLGSTLVLLGYRSGFGAVLLLLYWLPVTFIVHDFWNDPMPLQRMESVHFMKNIAICGGLLLVLVNGSGRFSIRRLFATSRVPGA